MRLLRNQRQVNRLIASGRRLDGLVEDVAQTQCHRNDDGLRGDTAAANLCDRQLGAAGLVVRQTSRIGRKRQACGSLPALTVPVITLSVSHG